MIGDIYLLKNTNLLYIEDDYSTQKSYKHMFDSFFKNVYCGSDGEDGLEIINQKRIDIIVTAIKLPHLDGIEFTKRVKEKSNIPIIFMTQHVEINFLLEAIKLNVIDYIVKPAKFNTIKEALEKAVDYMLKNNQLEIEIDTVTHYNPINKMLSSNKGEIVLPSKEAALLELLLNNRGKIVEKYMIEDIVYDGEYMSSAALKSLISKIRKKIPKNYIVTVRENGYIFK